MTQRQPGWKKKGYETREDYSAACRANKRTRKAALLSTKTKNTSNRILAFLWEQAEFDKPQVKITKEQIMAEVRCGLTVVKSSLKELREEGSIKPINLAGGRSVPGFYRLTVSGQATTPSDDHIDAMKAKQDRDATWRFLKSKYGPLRALEIMGDPSEDE